MRIVLDTNVFISGILRDSIVKEILVSDSFDFFMPEYALEEVSKYEKELIEKAGISEGNFNLLKQLLLENIEIVPEEIIKPYLEKAIKIMETIDIKDSPFLACAFAINASGIWSFDKDFLNQDKVRVFSIKEMIGYIY